MNTNGLYSMTGITGFMLILLVTTLSCGRHPNPDFSFSPADNPEAGDTIQFLNESTNAKRYVWEFDDGNTSNQESPAHIYEDAGIYSVRLTAINDAGEESVTRALTVNEPTVLVLIVLDSTGENALSGADVSVYDNLPDYEVLAGPQFSAVTDSEGVAVFSNLEPIEYHVWIVRSEAVGFWGAGGTTERLKQNEANLYQVRCTWFENLEKTSLLHSESRIPLQPIHNGN
jgi:hypothetical protein